MGVCICTCSICGVQFQSRQSNSHVCAQQSCRRQYKRAIEKKYVARMSPERRARMLARKSAYERGRKKYRPEQRACAMCGTMFTPRNSLNVNCSRRCTERSHHAKADARDAKLMAFRATRDRSCTVCGASFIARVNRQRTCSKDCSYQLRLNRQSDHRTNTRELRRVAYDRSCVHCGKSFTALIRKQITCSLTCRRAHKRDLMHDKRAQAALADGKILNGVNSTKNYLYERTCTVCESKFTGAFNAKFCSDACRRVNHNRTYGARLVERPEKNCVQCGRVFRPRERRQITCSRECAQLRNIVLKRDKAKIKWEAGAQKRAAIREERERQRALRAPTKRKNAFTISPTLTCPGCGGQVKRDESVCGCCSTICVEAAQQRTRVRTMGDSVAINERVLVIHFAIANIGGVDRMIQTSDAGIITRIIDDVAEILYAGKQLHHPVALIETTKSIPQIVREKMEAHMSPRQKQIAFQNRNPIKTL